MIPPGFRTRARRTFGLSGLLVFLILLSGFALLGSPSRAQNSGQATAPDFSVDSPLLYIPYGQKETVQVNIPLRLSGQPTGSAPRVEDSEKAAADGPAVTFSVGDFVRFDSGPAWLMTVTVKNADKVVAEQARMLIIHYGNQIYWKTYKLQPGVIGAANLTVSPPLAERLWHGINAPLIPIQVTIGGNVVRNVRVVSAGAQDAKSKQALAEQFKICMPLARCGDNIPEIRGPAVVQLGIRPTSNALSPGVYEGSFALVADGLTTPATFNLKFDATSWPVRIVGMLLIIAGTLIGLFLTYGLNVRAVMLQAARPAALVAARLDRTIADLAKLKQQYSTLGWSSLDSALSQLAINLGEEQLEQFGLRKGWWGQLRAIALPLDNAGLTAYLEAQGKSAATLDVLAKRGIGAALAGVNPAQIPAEITQAIGDLDALAARTDISDAATMLAAIQVILGSLAATHQVITSLSLRRTATFTSWTVDEVETGATKVGLLWLAVAGILTATIGTYVLILSNPGFGRMEDLVFCSLWGLGFSTGAGAIPSLTASQIRTTIALPKPV